MISTLGAWRPLRRWPSRSAGWRMRRRRRRHGRRGHRGRGGRRPRGRPGRRRAGRLLLGRADPRGGSAGADFEGDPAGAAGSLLETAQASRDLAPEEVAPLLDEGIAVLQGVADGGDPAAMESDFTPVHTYDLENCGWESSEVTAKDFASRDCRPTSLPGPHSFEITNSGAEAHVMVILAKAEGVTESWDHGRGRGVGPLRGDGRRVRSRPAPTGTSSLAGDYMALCPIPTGTTMAAEGTRRTSSTA